MSFYYFLHNKKKIHWSSRRDKVSAFHYFESDKISTNLSEFDTQLTGWIFQNRYEFYKLTILKIISAIL